MELEGPSRGTHSNLSTYGGCYSSSCCALQEDKTKTKEEEEAEEAAIVQTGKQRCLNDVVSTGSDGRRGSRLHESPRVPEGMVWTCHSHQMPETTDPWITRAAANPQ